MNKKTILILTFLIGVVLILGVSACAAAKTTSKNVKIYNFKPGVSWAPKAIILKNGDAIAGYVEYNGNMQFDRGTGITSWYIGSGVDGDINPHHTKLVKAKFFFKNKKGKVKTKTVTSKKGTGHLSTGLIKGYTPYKATVWYKSY